MTSGPPKVYAPLSKIESPRRTMCGIGLSSLGLRGEGEAFAGDEDGGGGRDTELFGVIALIHGDADSAAGVHVEQRRADRDFHEGLDVGQGDGFFVEEQRDFVAEAVSELLEFVAGNIGDERAKRIVQADDVALNALIADGDRKSTRLNSSHEWISYAVFCLKKKKKYKQRKVQNTYNDPRPDTLYHGGEAAQAGRILVGDHMCENDQL